MNEATIELIAKFYLGENFPRDYSDWAVSCLEQGLDTKNIRILASMFEAYAFSEIEFNFRRALTELGWDFPPKEEFLLLKYPRFIAKQIVERRIEPYEGCRRIYRVSLEFDHPKELRSWMFLDEGLDPKTYETLWEYDEPEVTSELKNAIIKEAKEMLNKDETTN